MRIVNRLRHGVLSDVTRGGIQSTDVGVAVTGVPDLALRIDDQVVRMTAGRHGIAPHLAAAGLQPANVVAFLAAEPDRPVRCHPGVTWPSAPWHLPFGDFKQGRQLIGRFHGNGRQGQDKGNKKKIYGFHGGGRPDTGCVIIGQRCRPVCSVRCGRLSATDSRQQVFPFQAVGSRRMFDAASALASRPHCVGNGIAPGFAVIRQAGLPATRPHLSPAICAAFRSACGTARGSG
jgi:hypothetical protein